MSSTIQLGTLLRKDTSYDEELTREVNTAIWGGAACFGSEAGGYWYI